jgi:hypothetical protein
MAPVAPDRADIQQHGLVLGLSCLEGFASPGKPLDRLMRCGLQVGGAGLTQAVGRHAGK